MSIKIKKEKNLYQLNLITKLLLKEINEIYPNINVEKNEMIKINLPTLNDIKNSYNNPTFYNVLICDSVIAGCVFELKNEYYEHLMNSSPVLEVYFCEIGLGVYSIKKTIRPIITEPYSIEKMKKLENYLMDIYRKNCKINKVWNKFYAKQKNVK